MRKHVLALVCGLAAFAIADDKEGLKLRLDAWFAADNDEARKKVLEGLEGVAVPKDLAGRVQAIRRSLPYPARKPLVRSAEKLADHESFFVPPKGYDAHKLYGTLLAYHGRHGDAKESFHAFVIPDDYWEEVTKQTIEDYRKKYPNAKDVTIKRPKAQVDWEDGLVIAPTWTKKNEFDRDEAEAVALAALERMNRSYAGDPDKVVITGISLGGAAAMAVAARHPDRFAGAFIVAGYDPNDEDNLKPLPVYIIQGGKDREVNVENGRAMDARLKEVGVTHVYREPPNQDHAWPTGEESAKVRAWMRERVRNPWPKEFTHRFGAGNGLRRCFWVEVPAGGVPTVTATAKDNEIALTVTGAKSVVLHLGEPLVDLEKDVVVRWGDKEVFSGKVARTWKDLLADLDANGFDIPRAAPGYLEVKAPE
ncbi:MAG TPA: prolyl oligopeptidase family serine peptidase [Planctomycetota bacterium]|nr:prolyl oligopeptidase family serine peptidase [Planctomycetota bacterium]